MELFISDFPTVFLLTSSNYRYVANLATRTLQSLHYRTHFGRTMETEVVEAMAFDSDAAFCKFNHELFKVDP